jgi:hypothetical protein
VGNSVQDRSDAVARVLNSLRNEGSIPMLQGWRNEQFAIRSSFNAPTELTVERAAAGLFGSPAFGVFVVGYVPDSTMGIPSHVWVGKRSPTKPTWLAQLSCGRWYGSRSNATRGGTEGGGRRGRYLSHSC